MICAGSGIAPFRPCWQQRKIQSCPKSTPWLYFGCRDDTENLFSEETEELVQRRVAFSRKFKYEKEYVQDLLSKDGSFVHDLIMNQKANIYICGKVSMGLDVKETLINILMV